MDANNSLIDLHPWAGLDARLDTGALALVWGPDVVAPPGETRAARDLTSVLYEPLSPDHADVPLYVVYRGVAPAEAQTEMARRGVEYAALVMRPGTISGSGSREWTRTRGHVNSPAPSTRIAFPEVHEVWHGHALLYLQNETASGTSDSVVIALSPGEKAVVAPGWASLLVNVGDTPLVTGSWRSTDCILEHEVLTHCGGMAHFILQSEPTSAETPWSFVPNDHYPTLPLPPRFVPARDLSDFGLKHGEPMLTQFRKNPDYFRFMGRPQDFANVWSKIYRDAGE